MIDNENDRTKMEQIIDLYSNLMHLQAFFLVKNNEDAEYAVQISMINICKHIKSLSTPENNRTKWYVLKSAKNAAIDIYRKNKRKWENEVSFDEISIDYEWMPQYDGDNFLLKQIMALSQRDRDILMLKYVYGHEYSEIANQLGISKDAAKKAGQRAREKLEKSIEGDSQND